MVAKRGLVFGMETWVTGFLEFGIGEGHRLSFGTFSGKFIGLCIWLDEEWKQICLFYCLIRLLIWDL